MGRGGEVYSEERKSVGGGLVISIIIIPGSDKMFSKYLVNGILEIQSDKDLLLANAQAPGTHHPIIGMLGNVLPNFMSLDILYVTCLQ